MGAGFDAGREEQKLKLRERAERGVGEKLLRFPCLREKEDAAKCTEEEGGCYCCSATAVGKTMFSFCKIDLCSNLVTIIKETILSLSLC